MSTKNHPLKAGLAAFGLIWTSAIAAGAQEAAPPIPAPAPTNAPSFAVLLMSNGRIIQGNVSMDKTGAEYLLLQKGGTIRFPKKDVERRFASMRELYEYKVATLAQRDSGERMQLAQWCLENHMNAEAREHLQVLRTLNPNDTQAERMIAGLDATAERLANSRDPEVRTTSTTVVDSSPREPDAVALPRPRGEMGRAMGQPVIFDLPAAVARKRAIEFTQYVHPVLQQACASCHNQTYEGDFQLIQTASRRDWTPEVVRSNLDATLRVVNRDDPLHSDLLSYAVNRHGPNTKPVCHGPNDPRYRSLSTWLAGLKSPDPSHKPGYPPPTNLPTGAIPQAGEVFGADRLSSRPTATAAAVPNPSDFNGVPKPKRSLEVIEVDATSSKVPPGTQFDAPFVPGGAMPTLPARGVRPASPSVVQVNPNSTLPLLGSTAPEATAVPKAEGLPNLPTGTPVPPPDDVIPVTKRSKKPKKIAPPLLDNFLKNRQQP